MKEKFKLKTWWNKHKPSKRRLIQLYAFLLYNANIKGIISGNIYTGNSKYACVPGLNCYSCPGAVGACPLGALQNSLAASNKRAPYYVLGILLLYGLMLGRTICGFLCPIGLGQELLYKIPTPKAKKNRFTRVLSYLKYVILLVFVVAIPIAYSNQYIAVPGFCKYICPAGTFGGAIGLLINPSNASMFDMLGPLFTWKFCVLVAVCVASVFIFRFFCRFLCPLGALYGLFNKFSLLGVKVEKPKCTHCGLCVSHCKMDVRHVGDQECINCGECIQVCPTQAISWKGSKLLLHPNAVEDCGNAEQQAENDGCQTSQAAVTETNTAMASAKSSVREGASCLSSACNLTTLANKRVRTMQIVAWVLALCVLAGTVVYFNFIDVAVEQPPDTPPIGDVTEGNKVGNLCKDFNVKLCGQEEYFSREDAKGKITVLNFWATWCSACLAEIPDFEKLYNDYSDKVNIIAINYSNSYDDAVELIDQKDWENYNMPFAMDDGICNLLGYKGALPMTVVLDANGVIVYNQAGALSYERLLSIIAPLL